MMRRTGVGGRMWAALAPVLVLLPAASCSGGAASSTGEAPAGKLAVTVASGNGAHRFIVERARTGAEQERGLMFRTSIAPDGGMLFWPYPPDVDGRHQPPREASFWMKNTPSPLDIIFIRADGTIAHIAENAVPFDETPLASGEPIGAVLEIRGGRAMELGIAEGDKVSWAGQ